MKKALCSILCVLVLVTSLSGCAEKSSPVDDFEYEMVNGEVVITGYSGTDLKIYIPSKINDRPVTRIGERAFSEYDMTHVTIPDTVTQIDEYAFYECKCLTTVEWSDNLKTIGKSAFYGCESMKSIKLPAMLERINQRAFQRCGLEQVDLPENLQFIGADSFDRCENLSFLEIPDNTEIEIGLSTENAGQVGYLTFFDSPVGGSNVTTYYDSAFNATKGNTEYEQLDTAIIVNADSYAYQQVEPYAAGYGLTIEAVTGSASKDQEDKNYLQDIQDAFGDMLDSLNPFEKKETLFLPTQCVLRNADGQIMSARYYSYNDSGLVISAEWDLPESQYNKEKFIYESLPCDGVVDEKASYSYDQYGNPTYEEGFSRAGVRYEYEYNDLGNVMSYTISSDSVSIVDAKIDLEYGEGGTIKQWRQVKTSEAELFRTIETTGDAQDGIGKIVFQEYEGELTYNFGYDDNGNMIEYWFAWENGEPSAKTVCNYDEEGRIIYEKGLSDWAEHTYQYKDGMLVTIDDVPLEYVDSGDEGFVVNYGDYEITYMQLILSEREAEIARYRWNQFCGFFHSNHRFTESLVGIQYPVYNFNTVLLLPGNIFIS